MGNNVSKNNIGHIKSVNLYGNSCALTALRHIQPSALTAFRHMKYNRDYHDDIQWIVKRAATPIVLYGTKSLCTMMLGNSWSRYIVLFILCTKHIQRPVKNFVSNIIWMFL